MRQKTALNFNWEVSIQDVQIDLIDQCHFEEVHLPHSFQQFPLHYFNEKNAPQKAWYRKKIDRRLLDTSHRIQLIFEGVMVQSDFYINRTHVLHSTQSYLPIVVDLNTYLNDEPIQEILVMVDAHEDDDIPPFGHVVDYLCFGGIYREATLLQTPAQAIKNIKVHSIENTQLKVQVDLYELLEKPYTLVIDLLDEKSVFFSHHETIIHRNSFLLNHDPQTLWSLDHPKLYILSASLFDGDTLIDTLEIRYAYRSISFEPDGFYLNHQRIQLIGLNRHQSYPYVGYAMPKSAQVLDAEILKLELGLNCVRTSHYPQSSHFLDRCDELGLLVIEELPGWQHIGQDIWKKRSLENIAAMIERDYNHPSIILWGVRINESKDDHDFYLEANRIAHQLDESRPTTGVRNFSNSELLENVYAYNDFNYMGDNRPLATRKSVVKQAVPYLVSEYLGHMFPTKKTDTELRRIEHTKRHLDVLNHALGDPSILGSIGWCMADYNTHADFGSGDRICYHGVMDIFRLPKLASSAYASQGLKEPYCVWGSNMEIGDREASMLNNLPIYTNCDYVELYKGDHFIQRFYPNKKAYPHLKHPPIILDDLIGQQIFKDSRFSHQDAKHITQLFNAINTKGFAKLSLFEKVSIAFILFKNRMSFTQGYELYAEVMGNWGKTAQAYHLKAYIQDQCVLSTSKGPSTEFQLKLNIQKSTLTIDDTYDTIRCVVSFENQFNHVLSYAQFPIQITLKGPLELIGPSTINLSGGSSAFWVKSTDQTGFASIEITHEHFGIDQQHVTIQKRS